MKLLLAAILLLALGQEAPPRGVEIRYELPAGGKSYRVTLAIVDAKNPDWIISQFVAGAVRTRDLGGTASTLEFADAVSRALEMR